MNTIPIQIRDIRIRVVSRNTEIVDQFSAEVQNAVDEIWERFVDDGHKISIASIVIPKVPTR